MSHASDARICRMSDLEVAEGKLALQITVVSDGLGELRRLMGYLTARIEQLEHAVAEATEATPEPEDALARLHSEFRKKCRKAEGQDQ